MMEGSRGGEGLALMLAAHGANHARGVAVRMCKNPTSSQLLTLLPIHVGASMFLFTIFASRA